MLGLDAEVKVGGGSSHVVMPLGFLLGGEVVTPSPCVGRQVLGVGGSRESQGKAEGK